MVEKFSLGLLDSQLEELLTKNKVEEGSCLGGALHDEQAYVLL